MTLNSTRHARRRPVDLAGELRALRLAAVRRGDWPKHSLEMWARIAGDARHRENAGLPLEKRHVLSLEVARAVRDRRPGSSAK